ncbi:MAG: septation protein SpoVG family protein [Clostridia bacterium]|nr:septation protein SpoVG family protein [Clostridia bacterium]
MQFQAKITREINKGSLVAVADVVVDNALVLHGVKLIRSENGMFLGNPSTSWTDRFGETHYESVFEVSDPDVKADMFRTVRDAYTDFEQAAARTQTGSEQDARAGPEQTNDDDLPFETSEQDESMAFGGL